MMREKDVNSVSYMADFVTELDREIRNSKHGGGNTTLATFLEATSAWLHDVADTGIWLDSVQKNPEVCSAFARILLAVRHDDERSVRQFTKSRFTPEAVWRM